MDKHSGSNTQEEHEWFNYGLVRGTVALNADCSAFGRLFAVEHSSLSAALATIPAEVEHVGSTAIPRLIAKPILDIAVGVLNRGSEEQAIGCLTHVGYNYFGYMRSAGGHVLDRLIGGRACVIVHVLSHDSFRWRKYLALRDYLRCNAGARERYGRGKQKLAIKFSQDRGSYSNEKRRLVIELEREAFRWLRRNRSAA